MTTARVTTFNVNQFDPPEQQRADLTARMKDSDVVLCQETVDLDLHAFARNHPGWGATQVRNGRNDGHANTGVLFRVAVGEPTDSTVVFIGDAKDTRDRYLTAVQIGGVWFWSAHIFPKRDTGDIAQELANIGAWVKAHSGTQCGGLDRNQCPPGTLERATGLTWHGVGIDGFLTNLPIANVAEFPKGFSDHPGVHADVTVPEEPPVPEKQTRVEQAEELLREARRRAVEQGKQERAGRIRRALHALNPKRLKPVASWPAIVKARNQSQNGPPFDVGLCLQRVRICYGIGPSAPDAVGAWNAAQNKHATTPSKVPRGYPIFWRGGSSGHGHIAISAGDGFCWSTDIKRPGYFDHVPIGQIHAEWGLTFLGYTEDLNGTPVTTKEFK